MRPKAQYNAVKSDQKHDQRRKQLLQTKQTNRKLCICCKVNSHESSKREKVKGMRERKKTLSEKKLYFNYTENKRWASECKSKTSCQISQRKHHTSMYDKNIQMMMATESSVIYPAVVVKVNNIMCQALLNTGARSSNASVALLDRLKLKLIKKETKNIEMRMSSSISKLEICDVEISELLEKSKINSVVYKVEKTYCYHYQI